MNNEASLPAPANVAGIPSEAVTLRGLQVIDRGELPQPSGTLVSWPAQGLTVWDLTAPIEILRGCGPADVWWNLALRTPAGEGPAVESHAQVYRAALAAFSSINEEFATHPACQEWHRRMTAAKQLRADAAAIRGKARVEAARAQQALASAEDPTPAEETQQRLEAEATTLERRADAMETLAKEAERAALKELVAIRATEVRRAKEAADADYTNAWREIAECLGRNLPRLVDAHVRRLVFADGPLLHRLGSDGVAREGAALPQGGD